MEKSFSKNFFEVKTVIYIFLSKHYKRLQYFHNEYRVFNEKYGTYIMHDETKIEVDSTLAQQFDLIQLNKENHLITASIFDHLLARYREDEEIFCKQIVNHIVKLLKKESRRYIKEE